MPRVSQPGKVTFSKHLLVHVLLYKFQMVSLDRDIRKTMDNSFSFLGITSKNLKKPNEAMRIGLEV
jgi:hypothetical protein